MRVLGLDIGTRRVGVAVSDELGMTAQPLETVHIGRGESAVPRIAEICEQYGVGLVVAGVPFELNGRAGKMVRLVRRVLDQVREVTGLSIEEVDERFTSRQVERTLLEADVSRARRKQVIDKLAAALILQGWLDSREPEQR
jgi:putative holliday junction resolvase